MDAQDEREPDAQPGGHTEGFEAERAEVVRETVFRLSIGTTFRQYCVQLEIAGTGEKFFGEKRFLAKAEILSEFDRIAKALGGALGLVELDARFPG